MPVYAKLTSLLIFCLLLSACGQSVPGQGFEIRSVSARGSSQGVTVNISQTLRLSEEARTALEQGVPLVIRVDMDLVAVNQSGSVKEHSTLWELSYLPLSEHYQLSRLGENNIQTFPRLRHALADLGRVRIDLDLPTGQALVPYVLSVRLKLDQRRLPAPMRLPAFFSAEWRLDSGWSKWPVDIRS